MSRREIPLSVPIKTTSDPFSSAKLQTFAVGIPCVKLAVGPTPKIPFADGLKPEIPLWEPIQNVPERSLYIKFNSLWI